MKPHIRIVSGKGAAYLGALGVLWFAMAGVAWAGTGAPAVGRGDLTLLATESTPQPRVLVDPRVELVSLIFRLAGNPEYTRCRVPSYAADADKQFGAFADHPVVQLARRLRQTRGVSYDACMNLAVMLTDAQAPALTVPLDPWPEFLDKRWTAEDASNFVRLAGQFAKDSKFQDFITAHQDLYRVSETRMRELLSKEAHLEWFKGFFGETAQPDFTVILGLLNGGNCYGPHVRASGGQEEIFCVLGVWKTDAQGKPVFDEEALPTVVHEFCHSYDNPIIDRHWSELQGAGEQLYGPVADKMRSQAYGNAQTMLKESLVRASVVRYLLKYEGKGAADKEIADQAGLGFAWMPKLSDLLGQYESQRDKYPSLETFVPRLQAFFSEYAANFVKEQMALEAKRPKVVSLNIVNGATDVNPGLKTIEIVFDRPMQDGSWSLVGGGPNFPDLNGQPHYDSKRTTWTVGITLKPDHDYEFWLNNARFQAFRSAEGVPLESVPVTFRTGGVGVK